MKTDIVERLNLRDASCSYVENIYKDAAEEILRLRAENEKLREVILRVDGFIKNSVELGFIRLPDTPIDPAYHLPEIVSAAAAALKETGNE